MTPSCICCNVVCISYRSSGISYDFVAIKYKFPTKANSLCTGGCFFHGFPRLSKVYLQRFSSCLLISWILKYPTKNHSFELCLAPLFVLCSTCFWYWRVYSYLDISWNTDKGGWEKVNSGSIHSTLLKKLFMTNLSQKNIILKLIQRCLSEPKMYIST